MSRAVTCNWPHGGMSGDDALLFDLALTRHARFIRRTARHLASMAAMDADDLVQEAVILL